ncbi:MAG: membrane protein insertion efficiency factor YidD [Pseudomonadota bacterium]
MNGVISAASVFVRAVSITVAGLLVGFVRLYQIVLSPTHGPTCRFQPRCSAYAIEALQRHGPIWGLFLTAWRLARCHPLGGFGYDPVPVERPSFKLLLLRFIHGPNHSA